MTVINGCLECKNPVQGNHNYKCSHNGDKCKCGCVRGSHSHDGTICLFCHQCSGFSLDGMTSEYSFGGKDPKPLVIFKDEGDDNGIAIGPVTSYDADARPTRGKHGMLVFPLVEFGTVDLDNGVHEYGWLSKASAMRLAASFNADFEEI